jgi:hypothetical protein
MANGINPNATPIARVRAAGTLLVLLAGAHEDGLVTAKEAAKKVREYRKALAQAERELRAAQ